MLTISFFDTGYTDVIENVPPLLFVDEWYRHKLELLEMDYNVTFSLILDVKQLPYIDPNTALRKIYASLEANGVAREG